VSFQVEKVRTYRCDQCNCAIHGSEKRLELWQQLVEHHGWTCDGGMHFCDDCTKKRETPIEPGIKVLDTSNGTLEIRFPEPGKYQISTFFDPETQTMRLTGARRRD
jgi:hypothetical protein